MIRTDGPSPVQEPWLLSPTHLSQCPSPLRVEETHRRLERDVLAVTDGAQNPASCNCNTPIAIRQGSISTNFGHLFCTTRRYPLDFDPLIYVRLICVSGCDFRQSLQANPGPAGCSSPLNALNALNRRKGSRFHGRRAHRAPCLADHHVDPDIERLRDRRAHPAQRSKRRAPSIACARFRN